MHYMGLQLVRTSRQLVRCTEKLLNMRQNLVTKLVVALSYKFT